MPPTPTYHVVPIPLPLLLHPVANEYPYSGWVLDAQSSFGGVRLPVSRDGFRMYFEYARAVIRSPVSDTTTRHQAHHFASEIYRVNLEQYGIAPRLRNNHDNQPVVTGTLKRSFDGDATSSRSAPGRSGGELYLGNTSSIAISSSRAASALAGPSRRQMALDELDEPMDLDHDHYDSDDDHDIVERASTPSPERERRRSLLHVAGTSTQRGKAAMLNAKTTNMRGQWRKGCMLVPVPNSRGVEPPLSLPPLRTLASVLALGDMDLALWLRFYDSDVGNDTRMGREIALCSCLGVMWSPSAPTSPGLPRSPRSPSTSSPLAIHTQLDNYSPGSPPEQGASSAPASVGRPSPSPPPSEPVGIERPRSVPAIAITPPTPTSSPQGPQSAPPASPPHTYATPSQFSYSYSQTHPSSVAYTHRYRHHSASPNPRITIPSNIGWESPTTRANHARDHLVSASTASTSELISPTSPITSDIPMTPPQSGYKTIMRNGVKYAVRWSEE